MHLADRRYSKELEAVREGEREFREWMEENIDKADLKAFNGTASSKEILESLDKQTYENLQEMVEPFYAAAKLEEAGRAKSDLRAKRSTGARKASTRFMKFAKTFVEFMKVYSGIVDILASLP